MNSYFMWNSYFYGIIIPRNMFIPNKRIAIL
jgi:hypothetical protein